MWNLFNKIDWPTVTVLGLLWGHLAWAAEPLTLEDSLSRAYQSNPEIASSRAQAQAESALVRSRYWLSNPRIGLMREANMNLMEQEMGPMTSWSVSQEILFPTKYFLMGSAQKARANSAEEEHEQKKLEIREQVLTTYYGLYARSRIVALLEAQRETLREIARIAEARRATGAAPQQDEMKAHVEQTRLENEILLEQQELKELQAKLNALLDREPSLAIVLPKEDLKAPGFRAESVSEVVKQATAKSNVVRSAEFMRLEAEREKKLAYWDYAPDFMLTYRRAFINSPANAYAFGVEASIPLWFFTRQSSQASAASAREAAAERRLQSSIRSVQADSSTLASKAETYSKLMKIYETALIPQATSTLNSSRAAYSAGKTNFLELLDSERSLYSIRIAYFETLAKYVATLAQLERVVGAPVSTLPFGDTHGT